MMAQGRMSMSDVLLRDGIIAYIGEEYGIYPALEDGKSVFRHECNGRPFAVLKGDLLSIKACDIYTLDELLHHEGISPDGQRGRWVSVSLDGTVPYDEVITLVDMSHDAVEGKRREDIRREPREWLIPANPKVYDVVHAFDNGDDTIAWRSHRGIRIRDTIFIYVTLPVAAILFKCEVVETDVLIGDRKEMMIRLLRRYDPASFTRGILYDEYGIYSVRGPRGVPYRLSLALAAD